MHVRQGRSCPLPTGVVNRNRMIDTILQSLEVKRGAPMWKLLLLLSMLTYLDGSRVIAKPLEVVAQSEEKSGQHPSGPRLTFREVSRSPSPEGELTHFALHADGFPQGKSSSVTGKWMNGRTRVIKGVQIDGSGRVLTENGAELNLVLGRMFPGEFIDFTLAADDGTAKASVEITLVPIEAVGNGGCRLSVRPMTIRGDVFHIAGAGFKPDQEINTVAALDGQVTHERYKTKGDGSLKIVVFPPVPGIKSGGEASLTASDTSCSVTVRYNWGSAMTQATSGRPATSSGPPRTPAGPLATPSAGAPQASQQERWQALFDDEYALYMQKKYDEALPLAQEALRLAESSFGPEHPNVVSSLYSLGALYHAQKKFADAEPYYRRALATTEKILGPDHSDVGRMLSSLGTVLMEQKKHAEAEPLYRRSLAIAEKTLRPDDVILAQRFMDLAEVLRRTNRMTEARQAYARAKEIRARRGVPSIRQPEESRSEADVKAEVAYRKGDYDTAVRLLRESASQDKSFVERYRTSAEKGSAAAQGILGVMYEEGIGVSRSPADAIRWFRKAADQGDPTAQKYLGDVYRRGAAVPRDYSEALKWYRRAADLGDGPAQGMLGLTYEKGLGVLPDPVQAYMWFTLAMSYFEGFDREKMLQVRERVSAGMSDAEVEKAERLAREWKPQTAGSQNASSPAEAGDLAWRAVDVDDLLWVLDTMFAPGRGGTLQLGEEVVTAATAKDVRNRVEREKRAISDEMTRAGFRSIGGDYEMSLAAADECKISQARWEEVGSINVVQNGHKVEFQGKRPLGCGVIVGSTVVMRPRGCKGTSPFRLVGKAADADIEMTIWDKPTGNHCLLGTLTRRSAQR